MAHLSPSKRTLLTSSILSLTLALMLMGACVDDRQNIGPAPPACAPGAGQCTASGGVNGGSDAGSDSGSGSSGSATGISVKGDVVQYIDTGFIEASTYMGEALISAPKAGGGTVSANLINGGFSLDNVKEGDGQLFRVKDTTAESDILSTLSYQRIQSGQGSITLGAVNEAVFSDLATCMLTALDPQSGHAILRLVRGSVPLSGAFVKDSGSLGQIAYQDTAQVSNCAYASNLIETSTNGFVILFNIPVPADGRIVLELTAPSPLGGTEDRTAFIDVDKGFVTYAWLDFL